mgnify:CR=1 FL=1
MTALTQSPAWRALEAHAKEMRDTHLRDLFADRDRFVNMSIDDRDLGILLDYSKNRVRATTMDLLHELAAAAGVMDHARRMFAGEKINWTEGRAVLHVALRNRANTPIEVDGEDVREQAPLYLAPTGPVEEELMGVHDLGVGGPGSRRGLDPVVDLEEGARAAAAILAAREILASLEGVGRLLHVLEGRS